MNIPKIIKEHHQAMIDKGFYDCPECKEFSLKFSKQEGTNIINSNCSACNGSGIDQNKNIGELLMLIVSELSEALEAHRNGRFAFKTLPDFDIDSLMKTNKTTDIMYLFEGHVKDTFEDEIADVFLRLFDLCGYLNYNLEIDTENTWFIPKENIGEELLQITKYVSNNNIHCAFNSIYQFAEHHNIPIEKHILAKMAYNKTRPHKHGKEY